MVDLNSLIDPSLGITLQRAVGINDLGQIIAGGTNASGQSDAFLLTPLSLTPDAVPSTVQARSR